MPKFHILLFYLFLFWIPDTFAQNVDFTKANFPGQTNELSKADKNLQIGDKAFNDGYYRVALQHYLRANDFNPNSADLNFNIGLSYLNSSSKNKAKAHFEKAYALLPDVTNDIHYWLGYCYHLDMDWDKAESEYNIYLTAVNQTKNQAEIKKTLKRLEECRYGREMVKNPIVVKTTNLGAEVNSSYTDYNPVLTKDQDQLMFTSRRPGTTAGPEGEKDQTIDEYWEDIYVSYSFNSKWTKPKNMGAPINTFGHESCNNLSPNGERLLLYMDNRGQGEIFESVLQKDLTWSQPVRLPEPVNTKYHESSASLSSGLDSLYFVSERPGGFGGKDIYLGVRIVNTGIWVSVQNLGPTINTEYDEESVFIMPDGKTLFFSSSGHSSMGGFDIFKSEMINKVWSKPVNLGYPLNTTDDDVNFVMTTGEKKGYYASVKNEGFGERDLYLVEFGEAGMSNEKADANKFISGKKTPNSIILKGIVTDSYNRKPLQANIQIFYADSAVLAEQLSTDPSSGAYAVFLPSGKSYVVNVTSANRNSATAEITLPPAGQGSEILKDFELSVLTGVTTLLKGKVLDKDSKKGIIASITIRDEVNETDIAKIKSGVNGDFEAAVPAGRTYSLVVKAEDYMSEYDNLEVSIDKKGQIIEKDFTLNGLTVGNRITLKNIFYDSNKATLRPGSMIELDRLIEMLRENPTMRIEISSHTDNKGSAEYNLTLSMDRSKSVVNYLISKEINAGRLENKGYGLTQPVADNETEMGRQMNRRTEFRILSK